MKLFYEDKTRKEEIYQLWQQAFQDTEAFATYYFSQVYPDNRVMVAVESDRVCSMIHLNPYLWQWKVGSETRRLWLHYIVGVATEEHERRKGYMAVCMKQVLRDLSKQGEPFTYLMPAKEEYYEPFQYVSLTRRKLRRYEGNEKIEEAQVGWDTREKHRPELVGFPERTETYLHRLELEMNCEGGEVLKLKPTGYCAVVPEKREDETVLVVLQMMPEAETILEQQVLPKLRQQYGNLPIEYMCSQPMMLRITDLERFVELLPYKGETKKQNCIVTDPICEKNRGQYEIVLSEAGCRAERVGDERKKQPETAKAELFRIDELTKWLLIQTHLSEQLSIMEIV